MHYRIDLAQAAACYCEAVIFGGLAEGASPGPDMFPGLHPNALQAASRQLFAQAKSVQGANQTSPECMARMPHGGSDSERLKRNCSCMHARGSDGPCMRARLASEGW